MVLVCISALTCGMVKKVGQKRPGGYLGTFCDFPEYSTVCYDSPEMYSSVSEIMQVGNLVRFFFRDHPASKAGEYHGNLYLVLEPTTRFKPAHDGDGPAAMIGTKYFRVLGPKSATVDECNYDDLRRWLYRLELIQEAPSE